ncbi:integrase catalytic domain-containing protein [Trichonephila clavipes]|nr:integrase catalytic domain-containing protein [Trichonephila clavipes]
MGDLPKKRVTPSYPFNNCGVDFCGSFMVKFKNQRKGVLNKVYVSIFVCLSTTAIHSDFVSDLTSKAFIACLKRVYGRRGKSSKMFSDNGRAFVGANIELKELHDLVNPQSLARGVLYTPATRKSSQDSI